MGRRVKLRDLRRSGELFRCAKRIKTWPSLTQVFLTGHVPRGGLTVETRNGNTLCAQDFYDVTSVWACFCGSDYNVPKHARLIIDLGGNIGAFAIAASEQAPASNIYSFEPVAATRDQFIDHIKLNQLVDRIHIRPHAVTSTSGWRQMALGGWGSASTHLVTSEHQSCDTEQVEWISFAELVGQVVEASRIETVDLLKVDIEGSEHEIFDDEQNASALSQIDQIQLEYHRSGRKSKLFERLIKSGFQCVRDHERGQDYGIAHFRRSRNCIAAAL